MIYFRLSVIVQFSNYVNGYVETLSKLPIHAAVEYQNVMFINMCCFTN
jgi:hypothetical protein